MKRIISMLLVFVLMLSALPLCAAAEETEIVQNQAESWEKFAADLANAEEGAPAEDAGIVREAAIHQSALEAGTSRNEQEPNDTNATADRIYSGDSYSASVYGEDLDAFRFEVKKTGYVIIVSASTNSAMGFLLCDSNADPLMVCEYVGEDSGYHLNEIAQILAPGTYYIYALSVDGSYAEYGLAMQTVSSVPMHRMYDPNSGEHFYTGSKEERDFLVSAGWHYEGVGFNFPLEGAPVYRLYEPVYGEHLYTMDAAEMNKLIGWGWQYEGVAFNSATASEVPQYRFRNPNSRRGAYHFTSSADEKQDLINAGWIYEGIGWYSCWE